MRSGYAGLVPDSVGELDMGHRIAVEDVRGEESVRTKKLGMNRAR